MPVDELLRSVDVAVGKPTTVSGRLFVIGPAESFLAADFDSFIKRERLAISDNSLIGNYLLGILPPYGGGPCFYDEDCTISGTVQRTNGGYELANLKSCIVKRDDKVIQIPISRG